LPGPLPDQVIISDWRIGLLNIVLMLVSLLYPIITTVMNKENYQTSETPVAIPTFWFEASGTAADGASVNFYAEQDLDPNNLPAYCADAARYDYHYSSSDHSFWNDIDIRCRSWTYGEMTWKEHGMGFVKTFVKEVKATTVDCANFTACAAPALETQRTSFRRATNAAGTAACTCETQQDWFAVAPTAMSMALTHQILTSDVMGFEADSDTTKAKATAAKKRIQTTVKNAGVGADLKFAEGDVISLSLEDWLAFAGDISLDEVVSLAVATWRRDVTWWDRSTYENIVERRLQDGRTQSSGRQAVRRGSSPRHDKEDRMSSPDE
jgi:hypothetical protein